jgi:GxxExxY protein
MITQKIINDISYRIIGCAIEVHKHLGPGLLESIYHNCMMDELLRNDLAFQSHVAVPINYKGRQLAEPLRLDLLVEDLIVVELKAGRSNASRILCAITFLFKTCGQAKGTCS